MQINRKQFKFAGKATEPQGGDFPYFLLFPRLSEWAALSSVPFSKLLQRSMNGLEIFTMNLTKSFSVINHGNPPKQNLGYLLFLLRRVTKGVFDWCQF